MGRAQVHFKKCNALAGRIGDSMYVSPKFLTFTWGRASGFVTNMEKSNLLLSQNLNKSVLYLIL